MVLLLAGCSPSPEEETVGSPPAETAAAGDDNSEFDVTVDSPQAQAIVEHFIAEGLPVGEYQVYNRETSPFNAIGDQGHLYTALAIFHDERAGEEPALVEGTEVIKFDESGGSVEIFDTPEELDTRVRQIEVARGLVAARDGELEPEYQVRQGTILLRLGHVMEAWVNEYEAALASYQG